MLKAAWELLRDSGRVLLEAAPEGMNLEDVRAHLLATEHVPAKAKAVQHNLRSHIDYLRKQIKQADDDLDREVRNSPLWDKYEMLNSVPGVGRVQH